MKRHLVRRALVAAAMCSAPLTALPVHAVSSTGVIANFEGHTIDLSKGWGDAQVCTVEAAGVSCYRSEQSMDQTLSLTASRVSSVAAASCSPALRLYDGTSFTGSVLIITTRGALLTMASLGFDNMTSSYKIGGCAANFYSGIQTGLYPGNTAANVQSASMLAGWNNTISSVLVQ
jgi:hypothetical protein